MKLSKSRKQNMKQLTEQFNKPTIIAIIGYSNAGKTSIANYIRDNYGATKFTPIDKLKSFLEEINGLEEGKLNTQEGKSKNPTGSEYSFGEILVNLFHFWKEHDSYFASRMLMKDLLDFFDDGNKLCVVESLRNVEEVATLNLVRQLCDANVFVLNVMGKEEIKKTSDNQFEDIEQGILEFADETFQVFNSYNSTVYSYVDDIVAYLASEPETEEGEELDSMLDFQVEYPNAPIVSADIEEDAIYLGYDSVGNLYFMDHSNKIETAKGGFDDLW